MTADHADHVLDNSPTQSAWFVPSLVLILLIGCLGSGLLWLLLEADTQAHATWSSYRDTHCAPEASANPARETWRCGRALYTVRPGSAPIEFQSRELQALVRQLPLIFPASSGDGA